MKKFFAGVSMLAVVIGGLAGCGGGPDRAAVQDKLEKAILATAPDNVKNDAEGMKMFKCVTGKGIEALSDNQVAELDKVLDEKGDKLKSSDLPKGVEAKMKTAAAGCITSLNKDKGSDK